MAGYTLRKLLRGAAAPFTPARHVVIEALEGRRLLSAAPGAAAVTAATPATATVTPSNKTYGTTLYLHAGQSFDGYLGVVAGAPVNSSTNKISASINWGDGSVSTQGVITVGASGHIDVGGAHSYSAAGDYSITITVSAAPIPVPGQATPDYILLLGTIHSKAIVAGNTSSGVTLHESAGKSFTATVGTFQFPAPGKDLSARISWGDGTTSAGTVVSAGASGLDVLKFNVAGTHTYAKAGTYAITVTVTQTNPPATYVLLTYVVTGGTGEFAGATGSGTIGVTGGEEFTFNILSN